MHSSDPKVVAKFGELPAGRIVGRHAALFGGMGYSANVDPSFQLGTGTWSGSICSDNVTPLHLVNIKRIAHEVRPWRGAVRLMSADKVARDARRRTSDASVAPERITVANCAPASISAPRPACSPWSMRPGAPVWIDFDRTAAIRDGVVVDFAAAAAAVRELKASAEAALGVELATAATAYPPCIGRADSRACRFVLEGAGFDRRSSGRRGQRRERNPPGHATGWSSTSAADRPASGSSERRRLDALDDRPGGGHHLDLILAGALGVAGRGGRGTQARGHGDDHLADAAARPGADRAPSIGDLTPRRRAPRTVHLAGGALMLARRRCEP